MSEIAQSVTINKPALPDDGYNGGLHVIRDARQVVKGTRGQVNTSATFHSLAGVDEEAFEWATLSKLDNFSNAGENVAAYAQAEVHGKGGTWAGCDEVTNTMPTNAPLVGREVDVWCTGQDTGNRVGVDATVGDSRHIRSLPDSGLAEGTIAVRATASGASPWAVWMWGFVAQNFRRAGLLLDSIAERAIHLKGKYVVGIDLSEAKTQSAIRLAPGQRMTFEATDQISWSWLDGRLRVQNGDVNVLEIDTTTGDIYKKGVKVL